MKTRQVVKVHLANLLGSQAVAAVWFLPVFFLFFDKFLLKNYTFLSYILFLVIKLKKNKSDRGFTSILNKYTS